ncbi:MAG: efflux RND transporter periplasmic adaptor subunit [Epsilonproteobacteria bacterium]|nr:efflux RND transporter periplasmic adaptor subunit [Campylobacterota bacterium]MBD3838862.1 efflux RND transporter periplasmic adaptor subunit [Campylobacterota bacterium]
MGKIFGMLMFLMMSVNASDVYATFNVKAKNSADLGFSRSGIIKDIRVDIGDRVSKNQVLAVLESEDIDSNIQIAKTNIENAKINLKFAKRDYKRYSKVKDLVDAYTLDKYKKAYESAQSALNQAQSNLNLQNAVKNKTVLKAPFDGVITDKLLELGDVVNSAGNKSIFKIQSASDVKLILQFDEKYWKVVKVGQKFIYRLDGSASKREGRISKIYPSANPKNHKMTAEVQTNGIMVGLFGDGKIIIK